MVPLVAIICLIIGLIIVGAAYLSTKLVKDEGLSQLLLIIGIIIEGVFILFGIIGLIIPALFSPIMNNFIQ